MAELKDGHIQTDTLTPERFGFQRVPLDRLRVDHVTESLDILLSVLNQEAGPARDIVVLNAGAAIYAANLVETLEEGMARAKSVIDNGSAKKKLEDLIAWTQTRGAEAKENHALRGRV